MATLLHDLRFAARMLWKSPGFTAIAILTLALGIGANTAIFSMVDSFLLRPLPVKDPGELVVLASEQNQGPLQEQLSYPDLLDIREQTSSVFADVTGSFVGLDGLSVNGHAERIVSLYVTGDYFGALGLKPALGRLILPSEGKEIGADPVLVLAHSYWKSRFNADPNIVGQKVNLDGHAFTIVGVAPEGFRGTQPIIDPGGFLPVGMAVIEGGANATDYMVNRNVRGTSLLARLKPGVTLDQARAALRVVSQRLALQYPETEKGLSVLAFPERLARPSPDKDNSIVLVGALFMALSGLVLVLACVNVANILLVRGSIRQREMAVRAAMGAARGRLIRQLLTESVFLALLGGVAGIALGLWGSGVISRIDLKTSLPIYLNFDFDWRIFAFAFAAALLTGVVVGVVPALRLSRGNLSAILHEGGRSVAGGRQLVRSALVVAQVSGSLMLLIIAGLFTRSLQHAQRADLGFDPRHVLNLTMDPNEIGFNEVQARVFYKQLLERVRSLPGVESASLALAVPMGYYSNADTVLVPGFETPAGQPPPMIRYSQISPGYFKTMSIGMDHGREFSDSDDQATAYVAIVNQTMAAKFWPHQDPVGRQFKLSSDQSHMITVVGMAKDSRTFGIKGDMKPYLYVPWTQNFSSLLTLQVRAAGEPEAVGPELVKEIGALAPDLPVFDVQPMTRSMQGANGFLIFQFGAALAAALGVLGLLLALVGVYGVVSYSASQRKHEIGIRMALGAQPLEILQMVLRQGAGIIAIGLAVGLLATFAAARAVGYFLIGVSPTDPLTYVSVSCLLLLVALTACAVPAWRAMRLDPLAALRHE
ncbi:MAG TPA: ABC transporter permease [Candidatus Acidoferrales bacterium]|nr:ABC transporter permease [Candidatus Acidoferrales bacterium]